MNQISLLNWMLLSTLVLGVWWLCYRLALRQERSFAYNRMYLVLGPLLAVGLPLLPLRWPVGWGTGPAALPGMATVVLPVVQAGAAVGAAGPNWAFWLWAAYVTGALLTLMRLGLGLGKLWLTARALPGEQRTGYALVRTHGRLPTSSFGRVVFWDETLALSAREADQVLRHELAHVQQGHTYDRLLLELLRAALWFNPFVHLCGRALGLTHEFLADAVALRDTAASGPAAACLPNSYAHLLARQVAGRLGFSVPLAHSFSQSQTLRRIAMIQQTSPIRRWKQWLALPLVAALLITVACEQQKEPVAPAGTPIPTAQLQDGVAPPPPIPLQNSVVPPNALYTYVEQMPMLPGGGGNAAIVEYIQHHLVYPNVPLPDRSNGRVFVSFTVSDRGGVQAVKIVKGLSAEYDAAVVAAVQQLPKFIPGKQNQKPVNVSFTVPVKFVSEAPGSTK